ncbi:MAG: 30S ribosomal protein S4e [Deltaproteobacteria bacterium]|nr:30S ribosomal protein S4e [Deltaproteobacteria bacterium]
MSKHMKRLAMPRTWSVPKKSNVWVTRQNPGPHPIEASIPLLIAIRDELKYCDSAREAKHIIATKDIIVDGKPVRDPKRPLGIMDVVRMPKMKEQFRVLPDEHGKLKMVSITPEEAKWKLVRIENKTKVRLGRTQLNCHDGRNILVRKGEYKTHDVLKIALPNQKVLARYPFTKGNMALVTGGKHAGKISAIDEYVITRSSMPNTVKFDSFSTIVDNVFIIGTETPAITIHEVKAI